MTLSDIDARIRLLDAKDGDIVVIELPGMPTDALYEMASRWAPPAGGPKLHAWFTSGTITTVSPERARQMIAELAPIAERGEETPTHGNE